MLGRISPRLYDSKYIKFMSFWLLVVEISHVEGWMRKIQFHDRGITHAIFIENGNKSHASHHIYNSHVLFGFEQSHAFWKHVIVLNNHVQFWVHVTVQNSHMHPHFACMLT